MNVNLMILKKYKTLDNSYHFKNEIRRLNKWDFNESNTER